MTTPTKIQTPLTQYQFVRHLGQDVFCQIDLIQDMNQPTFPYCVIKHVTVKQPINSSGPY